MLTIFFQVKILLAEYYPYLELYEPGGARSDSASGAASPGGEDSLGGDGLLTG